MDLHNNISLVRALSPVSVSDNTAQVTQIIDRANFDALEFAILTGSLADADATFTVLVEHGDESDLSDAAEVDDEQLLGTEAAASFTFAHDNETRKIGYIGAKRYVRMTITPDANASAAVLAVGAILGAPRKAPQA